MGGALGVKELGFWGQEGSDLLGFQGWRFGNLAMLAEVRVACMYRTGLLLQNLTARLARSP